MPRRATFRLILLITAALASEASRGAETEATNARPARRSGKFTLMALGDNRLADLARLPQAYDLMIASADVKPDVIDGFRRRNPGAAVFCYFNTSDMNADPSPYAYFARLRSDTDPHEDWFHHNAQGRRVKIYYPKYRNRSAFNTGNPDLQKYLAGRVVELLQSGRYDGIQLDNVSTEFPFLPKLVGNWISAEPVGLTPEQWTRDEVAMLRVIVKAARDAGLGSQSQNPPLPNPPAAARPRGASTIDSLNKTIIFNHMRSGEPVESKAYLDATDGANCEYWMSLRTGLEGRWGWKAKVDQVREANRAGKLTNLLCVPSTVSEAEAAYCFASYLMAMDGDRAYFFYGPTYRIAAQKAWFPFYDLDLGTPTGDYQPREGGFWRPFTQGGVAVNPTSKPITLKLPGRYRTSTGQVVDTISLGPKGAAFLLASN